VDVPIKQQGLSGLWLLAHENDQTGFEHFVLRERFLPVACLRVHHITAQQIIVLFDRFPQLAKIVGWAFLLPEPAAAGASQHNDGRRSFLQGSDRFLLITLGQRSGKH
jgi:hypothetical protein